MLSKKNMLVSAANIIELESLLQSENHQQISEKVMEPGLNSKGNRM